jgi:hypothetical protein
MGIFCRPLRGSLIFALSLPTAYVMGYILSALRAWVAKQHFPRLVPPNLGRLKYFRQLAIPPERGSRSAKQRAKPGNSRSFEFQVRQCPCK